MLLKLNLSGLVPFSCSRSLILLFSLNSFHSSHSHQVSGIWALFLIARLLLARTYLISHALPRCLRVIRRSVSCSIFSTLIHAFICSRNDFCISLLIGLPKVRLSPIQLVLNTAARLIARFPRYSHIPTKYV